MFQLGPHEEAIAAEKRPIWLFLDLEETVIDDIESGNFINEEYVEELIRRLEPDIIGLFTYAFREDAMSALRKNTFLRAFYERYRRTISSHLIPTIPQLKVIAERQLRLVPDTWSNSEFMDFYRKEMSFESYCIGHLAPRRKESVNFVLLDDTVQNKSVDFKDEDWGIRFIRAPGRF